MFVENCSRLMRSSLRQNAKCRCFIILEAPWILCDFCNIMAVIPQIIYIYLGVLFLYVVMIDSNLHIVALGRIAAGPAFWELIFSFDSFVSLYLYFVSITSRTTVTSARVPEADACHRACNFCVFSRVQKGTPRLTHKGCVLQLVFLDALGDVTVVLGMRQSIYPEIKQISIISQLAKLKTFFVTRIQIFWFHFTKCMIFQKRTFDVSI